MTAMVVDVDSMLGEVNRLLHRLEAPDVALPGAAWLAVTLRGMADSQARLFRAFEFHLQGQENAIAEIRQQSNAENARRSSRLVELTEILAGHGTVLAELQRHRKEEPARRRSLKSELEVLIHGQEASVVGLAQRLDGTEAMVHAHVADLISGMQQVRAAGAEQALNMERLRETCFDQAKFYEEVSASHGSHLTQLQQQHQLSSHAIAEVQRWVAGRQRSRVQTLETMQKEQVQATPSSSARGPRSLSASPGPGRAPRISTGSAVFPSSSPSDGRPSEPVVEVVNSLTAPAAFTPFPPSSMPAKPPVVLPLQGTLAGQSMLSSRGASTACQTLAMRRGELQALQAQLNADQEALLPQGCSTGGAFVARVDRAGGGSTSSTNCLREQVATPVLGSPRSPSDRSIASSFGMGMQFSSTATLDCITGKAKESSTTAGTVDASAPALSFGSALGSENCAASEVDALGSRYMVAPMSAAGSATLSTGSTLIEFPRPTVVHPVKPAT